MSAWKCVLPFPSDSLEFVLGFEAGRVYQDLLDALAFAQLRPEVAGVELGGATVHAQQAEMMLRIAEAMKTTLAWEELGDGWARAAFTRRPM